MYYLRPWLCAAKKKIIPSINNTIASHAPAAVALALRVVESAERRAQGDDGAARTGDLRGVRSGAGAGDAPRLGDNVFGFFHFLMKQQHKKKEKIKIDK
jgi:hypothetical protein